MGPKRWPVSVTHQPPASTAHLSPGASPPTGAREANTKDTAASRRALTEELTTWIQRAIKRDNFLQQSDDEIKALAKQMLEMETKLEVRNWSDTLMLPEAFAADVISRREKLGLWFRDSVRPAAAAAAAVVLADDTRSEVSGTTAASSMSSTARKKKGAMSRGRLVTPGSSGSGASLMPGLFCCGCFATNHAFKSNCANCGRIFCEQEDDSETCYACGMDPSECWAHELATQQHRLDEAAAAKERALYQDAVAKRDQLLTFAKERAKRTMVIDDQVGALIRPGAFDTKAERDDAQERERQRIADMHRTTGAYTVHLDIVRQNASLGAASILPSIVAAHVPPVPLDPKSGGRSGSSSSGDSDPDDDDSRCMPLPTLLQKVFYVAPGAAPDGTTTALTVSKSSGRCAAAPPPRASPPPKPSATRDKVADRKADMPSVVVMSTRVQTDYFADDALTWKQSEQQLERDLAAALEALATRPDSDPTLLSSEWLRSDSAAATESQGAAVVGDEFRSHVLPLASVSGASNPAALSILRSRDEGMCLSLHQPYASLLVAGIKTHEGRGWPTDHRGRLWIHAAGAKPTEVEDVERRYSVFAGAVKFPAQYPTGCLLGCVVVTDCLDRPAYDARFHPAQRQEMSEYSFICEGHQTLPVALPIEGKHKIFKLDKKTWVAARKLLGETMPK